MCPTSEEDDVPPSCLSVLFFLGVCTLTIGGATIDEEDPESACIVLSGRDKYVETTPPEVEEVFPVFRPEVFPETD